MCITAMGSICWLCGMAFSVPKRSDNCSTILQEGRFANFHEYWFQGATRWNMCSSVQQWVLFADDTNRIFRQRNDQKCAVQSWMDLFANTQESCFETWKRSYMGCSALLCCRFDVSQESCFQASKRSNMGSAVLKGGRSADFPNSVF